MHDLEMIVDGPPPYVDAEDWARNQGLCCLCGRGIDDDNLDNQTANNGNFYCIICASPCYHCGQPNPEFFFDANCETCDEKWDWRSMSAYMRM